MPSNPLTLAFRGRASAGLRTATGPLAEILDAQLNTNLLWLKAAPAERRGQMLKPPGREEGSNAQAPWPRGGGKCSSPLAERRGQMLKGICGPWPNSIFRGLGHAHNQLGMKFS